MAEDTEKLDQLQATYKEAVENWVQAIRDEEALASVEHSVADVDNWEEAHFREEDLRNSAKAAKKAYEDGLREEFYGF